MVHAEKPRVHGCLILFLLVVFFPVGIVLALVRMAKHRPYTHLKIMDAVFFSRILFFLFAMMSLTYFIRLSNGEEALFGVYLLCIAVLLLPGLAWRRRARRMQRAMDARFEQYRSLIYDHGSTSISHIAEFVRMRPDVVANELQRLAWLGGLPNVAVDMHSGRILLYESESAAHTGIHLHGSDTHIPTPERAPARPQPPPPPRVPPPLPAARTVTCSGCGAKVRFRPGEDTVCEYCQTPVHDA